MYFEMAPKWSSLIHHQGEKLRSEYPSSRRAVAFWAKNAGFGIQLNPGPNPIFNHLLAAYNISTGAREMYLITQVPV